MVKDPFRQNCNAFLALCETYIHDQVTPARCNFRTIANQIMEEAKEHDPWFGIEQEFFMVEKQGGYFARPLGFPKDGFPEPQGQYYCGVGASNAIGRNIMERSYRCMIYAGLQIAGINGEVAPGQWEYQVGITRGIECGDHMWLAKYILGRVGEQFGVDMDYEPKPVLGDWNGSGCHTNFSTKKCREDGGYDYIVKECMPRMAKMHNSHIFLYGEGNEHRLTGLHETSSMHEFSYKSRSRGASVRIPVYTEQNKKGYFEDRRPASNIDPYLVSGAIVDTCCLESKYMVKLIAALEDSRNNKF